MVYGILIELSRQDDAQRSVQCLHKILLKVYEVTMIQQLTPMPGDSRI